MRIYIRWISRADFPCKGIIIKNVRDLRTFIQNLSSFYEETSNQIDLHSYDLLSIESKLQLIRQSQKLSQTFIKPVVKATYRKSDQMIPLLPGKLKLNLQDDFGLKPFSPACKKHIEGNKEGLVLNTRLIMGHIIWVISYGS